jgi:DNA modification methylase
MLKLNEIYCGDCCNLLKKIDNEIVDLIVTSPPYNNLRNYEGYVFDFENIAKEIYRVIKQHGVVVWVVGDEVVNGSETGTSFKQALYFKKIGFNIHDTMIYQKNSSAFPARRNGNRYTQIFEYCFVFSKGKPKTHNLICDKKNKWAGHTNWGNNTQYNKKGELIKTNNIKPVPDYSVRNNIWKYTVGFNDKTGHPAVFPEALAKDHILTWSTPGDLILDPFCGSGTTLKMSYITNRKYIGIDISQKYCNMAKLRIQNTRGPLEIDMFQKE